MFIIWKVKIRARRARVWVLHPGRVPGLGRVSQEGIGDSSEGRPFGSDFHGREVPCHGFFNFPTPLRSARSLVRPPEAGRAVNTVGVDVASRRSRLPSGGEEEPVSLRIHGIARVFLPPRSGIFDWP